ncbi:MAG: hypothetical protein ACYDCI_00145 [Candidatus Limnocylindrales bacterium]
MIPPLWRFRGTSHYLDHQAERLGVTQVLADRARQNPEIVRSGALITQLAERYHRTRRQGGVPLFYAPELAQVKGTLEQCELERQKLHVLAAAADEMLAEAWAAFGLAAPARTFGVESDYDTQTLPLGDGTVGVADDAASPALSESG